MSNLMSSSKSDVFMTASVYSFQEAMVKYRKEWYEFLSKDVPNLV